MIFLYGVMWVYYVQRSEMEINNMKYTYDYD